MIRAQLMKKLMATEGIRLVPYRDSGNKLTVGIGHKVLQGDKINDKKPITAKKAKELFLTDIMIHQKAARDFIGKKAWDTLSPNRQDALTEMAFNAPIHQFKNMRDAIQAGDMKTASDEMLDSKWYRENNIPGRVQGIYQSFSNDSEPSHFTNMGDPVNIQSEMEANVNRQIRADSKRLRDKGGSHFELEDIRHGLSPKSEEKLVKKGKKVDKTPKPFMLTDNDVARVLGRSNSKNRKASNDRDFDRDRSTASNGIKKTTGAVFEEDKAYASLSPEEKLEIARNPKSSVEREKKTKEAEALAGTLKLNGLRINREADTAAPGGMLIPSDPTEIQKNTGVSDFSKIGNQRNI